MDIAALKQATQAATPGGWTRDKYGSLQTSNGEDIKFRGLMIACSGSNVPQAEANTDFIAAANPAAVLALIASHERLVAALKECAKHPRKAQRDNIVAKALAAAGAA